MGLAPAFAEFLSSLPANTAGDDLERLHRAWSLAIVAHHGQLRTSGEPYVTHPLAVAAILNELLDPGIDALCAALLHDVVEDSDVTLDEIEAQFGPVVAHIVDGVSKLDAIRADGAKIAKDETLRKLVVAGGRDWRVFAVKLSDRLHNMRTLGAVSVEKRRRVALETHQVFFPLARYVGFHSIASELEALSLRALYPWRWRVVSAWVGYRGAVDARRVSRILDAGFDAAEFLGAQQIEAVNDRRIVQSFQGLASDRAIRVLFGVPSLAIECRSMQDAYSRVCALHGKFVFVPGSFHCEAVEGYVSTKVLLSSKGPVVELVARFPRVSRESWGNMFGSEANSDDFVALAGTPGEAGQFTSVLRDLVGDKSIVVFSPKGRRVSLPRRSIGLDFAFAIHTELGLRTIAVLINGVKQDATSELSSGDIVEVIASDVVVAKTDWESRLRSPRSRAKLRQWLRESARVHAVELGRRLLLDAFRVAGLPTALDKLLSGTVLASLSVVSIEALLQRLGEGDLSARSVVGLVRDPEAARILGRSNEFDALRSVELDGKESGGLMYCRLCLPLPGDDVVCSLSADGAMVHRVGCDARRERRLYAEEFVPRWVDTLAAPLPAVLRVVARDRHRLLADCAFCISNSDVNVSGVATRSYTEMGVVFAELVFHIAVTDAHAIDECVQALLLVDSVQSAVRLSQYSN